MARLAITTPLLACLALCGGLALPLAGATGAKADAAPPIGGGFTGVVAIPVDDPATKAIAGALIKPAGAGPFPTVVYLPGCGNNDWPAPHAMAMATIEHLTSKGVATFFVDSFAARNEPNGVCAVMGNLDDPKTLPLVTRDSNDALAALKVVKTLPGVDTKHIFLMGYSYGGTGALMAVDKANAAGQSTGVTGVIAYFPHCYQGADPAVPVLVMVGDKDDWTPAAKCQALTGKSGFELVVYPGLFHAFTYNFGKPADMLGHHMEFDAKATEDAQQRADAFIAAHLK